MTKLLFGLLVFCSLGVGQYPTICCAWEVPKKNKKVVKNKHKKDKKVLPLCRAFDIHNILELPDELLAQIIDRPGIDFSVLNVTCERFRRLIYFISDWKMQAALRHIEERDPEFDLWFYAQNSTFQRRLYSWMDGLAKSYVDEEAREILEGLPDTVFKRRYINKWFYVKYGCFFPEQSFLAQWIDPIRYGNAAELRFDQNYFFGVPAVRADEMFQLGLETVCACGCAERVRHISISYAAITELPPCIGEFRNLDYLWIFNCQLSRMPRSIGNLKKLRTAFLQGNRIVTLPDVFYSLAPNCFGLGGISSLDLSYNDDMSVDTYFRIQGAFKHCKRLAVQYLVNSRLFFEVLERESRPRRR